MSSGLPAVLFSADEIADRIRGLAKSLAALPQPPQVAAPVLVGAFIFAADLMRALAREGVHPDTEMLWLRSYGNARTGGDISVLAGPSEQVKGKRVLLLDTILDKGHTLARAHDLLRAAGAAAITTVVALDKRHDDAVMRADFALFTGVKDFIVGYGTDDAGKYRGLPYIGKVEV